MSMTLERLPATGRQENYGTYIILGYADEDLKLNMGVLQSIAKLIDERVFGMERAHAAADVAVNLRNGGSMTIVAMADTHKPVGYSSQRILAPVLEGNRRKIMFTTTRAIEKDLQGQGLGPETLRFSFNMHGAPDIVAGIVGWAPPIVAYYESGVIAELEGDERATAEAKIEPSEDDELNYIRRQLALVKLYPIIKPYSESDLMQEALVYVVGQSRYKGHSLDREIGLLPSLWDKDSTQLYNPEKASRRVQLIGSLLRDRFNLDSTKGDAMVVMGPKTGWKPFID